jgi:hypothetical protein
MSGHVLFGHGGKVEALAQGRVLSEVIYGGRVDVGTIVFDATAKIAVNNTVTINGVAFKGVASGATGNQFNVTGTLATDGAALAAVLNASTDPAVNGATYTFATATLTATLDSDQNTGKYAIATNATSAVVTQPTGGNASDHIVDPVHGFPRAETFALKSLTGGNMTVPLGAGDEGQEVTFYLATKGGTATVTVTGSFRDGSAATKANLLFDATTDYAKLKYLGGVWQFVAGTATFSS